MYVMSFKQSFPVDTVNRSGLCMDISAACQSCINIWYALEYIEGSILLLLKDWLAEATSYIIYVVKKELLVVHSILGWLLWGLNMLMCDNHWTIFFLNCPFSRIPSQYLRFNSCAVFLTSPDWQYQWDLSRWAKGTDTENKSTSDGQNCPAHFNSLAIDRKVWTQTIQVDNKMGTCTLKNVLFPASSE